MKSTPQVARWAALAATTLLPALAANAQSAPATQPAGSTTAAPPADEKPPMKAEEIEALVAPVALYSDSLLSQVLMAATYPVEVVQAQRWLDAKGGKVKDDATAKELEAQTWDASVKSLCNVPQTLKMMSEKLDWTSKLGDAVLQDQKAVMDAVQRLRAKANASGNLKSNEQQKVTAENTGGTTVYVIEQSDPEVIYVPTYNPTVVYGSWPYPAYPAHYYYPPGYVASNVVSFGVGVACGLAWGYAWGNCNWGGGDIDIDCNRNVNRNTNINRDKARQNASRSGAGTGGRGGWKHDAAHRGGASYRNQATANKVGAGNRAGTGVGNTAGSRDALRGRTDPGAGSRAGGAGAGTRDVGAGGNRGGAGQGAGAGTSNRGAFGGSSGSGSAARNNSSRGSSSLGGGSRPSGGASRSSGGASRGGGSRGGGGRGGGGRR